MLTHLKKLMENSKFNFSDKEFKFANNKPVLVRFSTQI